MPAQLSSDDVLGTSGEVWFGLHETREGEPTAAPPLKRGYSRFVAVVLADKVEDDGPYSLGLVRRQLVDQAV
ncbi:hypothetical protein ABZT47_12175 [Sphaerisporangium sp. NPDC005289]|uniref:hypothetical protein n=1 Tax=Sphaerisporangium sp. NPDC005289 TaxID=3155247 RepID=UPI0033B6E187